jgi:hypothetical protein
MVMSDRKKSEATEGQGMLKLGVDAQNIHRLNEWGQIL